MVLSTIVLVFLSGFITHIQEPLSSPHGDAFLVNFILHHYMQVFSRGDWSQWTDLPMLFGFHNTVFFTEFYPIHALLAWPLWKLSGNIFFASNILAIGTILFSAYSMYAYLLLFGIGITSAIFGSIVFALNPFLFARFPDHLLLVNVGWIPISLACIELTIQKKDRRWLFGLCMVLILQLLTSSLHYSIFLSVFLPLYVFIRTVQTKNSFRLFWSRWMAVGFILFSIAAISVGLLYKNAFAPWPLVRGQETAQTYAAVVSDWFFTAPSNALYGKLKPIVAGRMPTLVREGIYSEQNIFAGILVIVLCTASIVLLRRSVFRSIWILGIFCILFGFLLSLGPTMVLSEQYTLAGPYRFIAWINPLFFAVRVPARFAIFSYIGFALISGCMVETIIRSLRGLMKYAVILGLFGILFLEYATMPLTFSTVSSQTQSVYAPLSKRSDIHVIVDLPIGNLIAYPHPQARMEDDDARYLRDALLYHNKVLFNGYTGFLPSLYYERANALSIHFPTAAKLHDLTSWGVQAIVLHKDEYRDTQEYKTVYAGLQELGVPLLSHDATHAIFDLTAWKAVP